MSGYMELGFHSRRTDTRHHRRGEEVPFRLLVLGNLSGRSNRGEVDPTSVADRRPIRVDLDNFDAVLARIAPRLRLTTANGADVHLEFRSLDDFHPDALYQRVPVFADLRDIRERLAEPRTFGGAAAEFQKRARAVSLPG
ncbi:MAG: type VI secretion system contractile sheath small subunit, partial [Proteobacteria bacterium]|nr:type VI secretion system contractile sheath small subunit [Pseudomonadota bacterium]